MKKIAVVSMSGGLDSTCLALNLMSRGYEVRAYAFDYGQRHSLELEKLKENVWFMMSLSLPISLQVINLRGVFNESCSSLNNREESIPKANYSEENMKSTVVENRNIIFSSIIYSKALSISKKEDTDVVIALGIHSGDHCFTGDTKILTPQGYKTINELKIGDEVYSFDGKNIQLDKCLDIIEKGTNNQIYNINTPSGKIRLTGKHKVFTVELGEFSSKGGFNKTFSSKLVEELVPGDILLTSRILPKKETHHNQNIIHITPIVREWVSQFGDTYNVIEEGGKVWISFNNRSTKKYDSNMDAKSLLSLMAWYITEGWSRRNWKTNPKVSKFSSSFSQSAYKNLHNCVSIEGDLNVLGIPVSITHSKHKVNGVPVESTYNFNSVISVLMHTCGDFSREKHIPNWIMEFLIENPEFIEDFIHTLICGDGHFNDFTGMHSYTTNSHQLALDVSFLVKLSGLHVIKVIKNKTAIVLNFGNTKRKSGLIHFGDASMVHIKSIEIENKDEKVFDISVEKNHNFFAGEFGNILISNSLYPDTTKESRDAAEHAFKISNWGSERVSYETPFVELSKKEVLQSGIEAMNELGLSYNDSQMILSLTHSCYDPNDKGESCGTCGTCVERLEAFKSVGIEDPIKYSK